MTKNNSRYKGTFKIARLSNTSYGNQSKNLDKMGCFLEKNMDKKN